MNRIHRTASFLAVVLLATSIVSTADAQRRQQIVGLGGGFSRYDIGGVKDNTYVLTLRFDGGFGPYVVFEPGATLLRFRTPSGSRNYILPELSLQLQGFIGPVRPFIGGGFGFANIATGVTDNQWTLHATSGVRINLGGPWGLRLEARARSIDPWYGHTLDFSAGIMRVLPSY